MAQSKRRGAVSGVARPLPPDRLFSEDAMFGLYLPAPEVVAWMHETFLREGSKLFNPEHAHLIDAHIGVLWTSDEQVTKGKTVAGTAEIPMFRCAAWQRGRQEQQMREWFGAVPQFLITLSASYAIQASDAEFCALVEHELYHCGQEHDGFGAPKFTKDGFPKYAIRGHDVEEFVGVVRRYGAGNAAGETAKLVEAANRAPEIANVDIRHACGTCHLKVA